MYPIPRTDVPSSQHTPRRTCLLRVGLLLTAWLIPIVLAGTLLLAQFVPGLAGPLSHVVPGLLPSATVTITLSGGNGSTLPTNPHQISMRLLIVVGL
jgi:hypothetical protein